MRATIVSFVLVALMYAASGFPQDAKPVRPGVREAEKLQETKGEPPQFKPTSAVDPAKLKAEADELAKRAQSIPAGIERVTKGQLPRDLNEQLKEIEKLAKQLRRQISG